jgi:hypothetical protein
MIRVRVQVGLAARRDLAVAVRPAVIALGDLALALLAARLSVHDLTGTTALVRDPAAAARLAVGTLAAMHRPVAAVGSVAARGAELDTGPRRAAALIGHARAAAHVDPSTIAAIEDVGACVRDDSAACAQLDA